MSPIPASWSRERLLIAVVALVSGMSFLLRIYHGVLGDWRLFPLIVTGLVSFSLGYCFFRYGQEMDA